MVSLNWCCKQKTGIRLIEPNNNLVKGYLKMAEDFLGTMNREKKYNLRSAISSCYYAIYYSLYSICMAVGVKCEIHSCTLVFMKEILSEFYSKEDITIAKRAFDARNIAQYYVDRVVSKEDSDYIMQKAPQFIRKSKEILSKINEDDIVKIRNKIQEDK